MAANQPTPGREVLPAGIDVRKIRKPINDAFASVPIELIGEGAATSTDGRRMSFTVLGEDAFYIRLDNKTTVNGTVRYGWKAVNQDRDSGNWTNSVRAGNATTDDWAVELNNANLTVGAATRYPARVNPQTGRVTFFQGSGSGGNVNATSTETVLMILGTYDEYANCPNVPPKPPTLTTDFCNGATGTELCVPAYAYAVYQRCGYVWNKIGDTRTYQVWANEMNGGSTSAWRRFVIPRWGGNLTETGPDPNSDCVGVAFLGSSSGALTCTCPTWASSLSNCIKVNFKTIPRPCVYNPANISCGYTDCADIFTLFDAGDAEGPYWDRNFSVQISGSMCNNGAQFGGGSGAGNVGIEFVDTERTECYWGPSSFDPCNPCNGFGKFRLRIELNTDERPNCGGVGHVYGDLSFEQMLGVLCDCTTAYPTGIETCDGCDGGTGKPPLVVIDPESIEVVCCP